jgi:hypothetical protein
MESNEKDKSYLEDLRKHSETALNYSFYSMQRIDLLIISVSGAGIYLCLEILKYIHDNKLSGHSCYFKFIGLLFMLSIILNFISQWGSYYANIYDSKSTKQVIYDAENDTDSKEIIAKYDLYAESYNSFTKITNILQ